MAKPIGFKRLENDYLLIFEGTGIKDDYINMLIDADVPEDRVVSRTVFVEGTLHFERLTGIEGPNPIRTRTAGETTLDEQQYTHVNAGEIRLTVTSDTFKYFCISHPANKRLRGSLLRLKKDTSHTVLPGSWLFVATGAVEVNGDIVEAPHVVSVENKSATIVAREDSYVAQIFQV